MVAAAVLLVMIALLGVLWWRARPPRLGSLRSDPLGHGRAPDAGPGEVGDAVRPRQARRGPRGILGGREPGATGGWYAGGGGDGGGGDGGGD